VTRRLGNLQARSSTARVALLHDDNLNIPFTPQHVDAHVVRVTDEQQINRGPGQFQVVNSQFAQRRWQALRRFPPSIHPGTNGEDLLMVHANRREFLKSSTLVAGAALFAAPAIARGQGSPNERFRVGLLGVGNRVAAYELDIIRWGMGLDRHPVQVTAVGRKFMHEDDDCMAPSHCTATFQFDKPDTYSRIVPQRSR
jgi:hypothetical protein